MGYKLLFRLFLASCGLPRLTPFHLPPNYSPLPWQLPARSPALRDEGRARQACLHTIVLSTGGTTVTVCTPKRFGQHAVLAHRRG